MKNLIIETESDINEVTEALNDAGIRCVVYTMGEYVSVLEKLAKLKELAGEGFPSGNDVDFGTSME